MKNKIVYEEFFGNFGLYLEDNKLRVYFYDEEGWRLMASKEETRKLYKVMKEYYSNE